MHNKHPNIKLDSNFMHSLWGMLAAFETIVPWNIESGYEIHIPKTFNLLGWVQKSYPLHLQNKCCSLTDYNKEPKLINTLLGYPCFQDTENEIIFKTQDNEYSLTATLEF